MSKYILCLLLLPIMLHAEKKTVCLNMIVKNEKDVIERCLQSVLPMIDYWVIVDTGSTDGTQAIIQEFMKKQGVPGELHERPWVNFAHNRNEALSLAKGKADYVLFIDADEYFVYDPDFKRPELGLDYYYISLKSGGSTWGKISLINNHQDWKWQGVLHEVIAPTCDQSFATLTGLHNVYTSDGARSKDPKKYQKDAEVLEAALKDEPDSTRYVFYLAESYANANMPEKALINYEKRASMKSGFMDEVFWSYLQIGLLQEKMNGPKEVIVQAYRNAAETNRARIEPYYHLACYYRSQNEFEKGYQVANLGLTVPYKEHILFMQNWMYDYGMLLEQSVCAYWAGRFDECQKSSLTLLKRDLPNNIREIVEQNLGFANVRLLEAIIDKPEELACAS